MLQFFSVLIECFLFQPNSHAPYVRCSEKTFHKVLAKRTQHHSTLLSSTLSDGVVLHGQTNGTCCAVRAQTVEIKDLGRIMITNCRPNFPLPLPKRWLVTRARAQKCWTMLHQTFDGNQTSFNIIQHDATSRYLVVKRVHHATFNNVERCWITMFHSFGQTFQKPDNKKKLQLDVVLLVSYDWLQISTFKICKNWIAHEK